MVRNGKTAYRVVIPENATSDIEYAKSELSRFFKEATGINLRFVSDKNLTHSADNRYISLGNTNLYKSLNRNDDITALKKDGINCAEITFRTACAAEAISLGVSLFPDMNTIF